MLQWEKNILNITGRYSWNEFDKIRQEQQELMGIFNIVTDYFHLTNKVRVVADYNSTKRTKNELIEFKKFADNPLFKSEEVPSYWKAKIPF